MKKSLRKVIVIAAVLAMLGTMAMPVDVVASDYEAYDVNAVIANEGSYDCAYDIALVDYVEISNDNTLYEESDYKCEYQYGECLEKEYDEVQPLSGGGAGGIYPPPMPAIIHTVTFDLNGGNMANNPANITFEVPDGERVSYGGWVFAPQRPGYTFLGWQIDGTGSILNNPAMHIIIVTAPLTIVAAWEVYAGIEHTVIFDLNGGNVSGNPDNIVFIVRDGESIFHHSNIHRQRFVPRKQGYRISGWQIDGTGSMFLFNATNESKTLVAAWTPIVGNNGDEPIWQIHNAVGEVGPGTYVDVRLEFTQTTIYGLGASRIVLNFDNSVIAHPRLSPRVDRASLTSGQQWMYDWMRSNDATDQEISDAFPRAQGTNGGLQNMSINSLRYGSPALGYDQISIMMHNTVLASGVWDTGLFIDIRFEVVASSAPVTSPITFHDIDLAGSAVPGIGGTPPPQNLANQIQGIVTIMEAPVPKHVTFNLNGGNVDGYPDNIIRQVMSGSAVGAPVPVPKRDNNTLAGWQIGGVGAVLTAAQVEAHTVTAPVTFVAAWQPTSGGDGGGPNRLTVTFDLQGGSAIFPLTQTVVSGARISAPTPEPTRENFTFVGWYTAEAGGTQFDFATPITASTTLFARWHSVLIKLPDRQTTYVGDTINWILKGFHNPADFNVTNFTIIDAPGLGLNFHSGRLPAFTNGSGITYDILYRIYGDDTWRTHRYGIDASQPFSFGLPQDGSTFYPGIKFYFGDVPVGFGIENEIVMTFIVGYDAPNNQLINRFFLVFMEDEIEGKSPEKPNVLHPDRGSGSSANEASEDDSYYATRDYENFVIGDTNVPLGGFESYLRSNVPQTGVGENSIGLMLLSLFALVILRKRKTVS